MADLEARRIEYEYEPDTFSIVVDVPRVKCQECGVQVQRKTRYTPDFRFVVAGEQLYVEAKGKLTPHERRRLEAFWEQHVRNSGCRDFSILFMRDNWLTAGKKERYTDWARKLGIRCAVGDSIPGEWL